MAKKKVMQRKLRVCPGAAKPFNILKSIIRACRAKKTYLQIILADERITSLSEKQNKTAEKTQPKPQVSIFQGILQKSVIVIATNFSGKILQMSSFIPHTP